MSQKRENQGALGSFFLTTVCQKFLCMPNWIAKWSILWSTILHLPSFYCWFSACCFIHSIKVNTLCIPN
jgi:hypothetical protein